MQDMPMNDRSLIFSNPVDRLKATLNQGGWLGEKSGINKGLRCVAIMPGFSSWRIRNAFLRKRSKPNGIAAQQVLNFSIPIQLYPGFSPQDGGLRITEKACCTMRGSMMTLR